MLNNRSSACFLTWDGLRREQVCCNSQNPSHGPQIPLTVLSSQHIDCLLLGVSAPPKCCLGNIHPSPVSPSVPPIPYLASCCFHCSSAAFSQASVSCVLALLAPINVVTPWVWEDCDSGSVGFCNAQGLEGFCFLNFFIASCCKSLLVKQVYTCDCLPKRLPACAVLKGSSHRTPPRG